MEDIIDADYAHVKRVCKDFEKKTKKLKRISWFLHSNRYIIVSWSTWEFISAAGLAWQTA